MSTTVSTLAINLPFAIIGALYLVCLVSGIGSILYARGHRSGMATQQRLTAIEAHERLQRMMDGIRRAPVQRSKIAFAVDGESDADAADRLVYLLTGMPALDEREPWEGE